MTAPVRKPAAWAAAEVAAYLRENPGFLAEHPDLYRLLAPPRRVHGDVLADHMAAILHAERAHAADLLAFGRAAAGLARRVQTAVLALVGAADPLDCVSGELPGLLGLDAIALCIEGLLPGATCLPDGTIEAALGGRVVVLREQPADAALFHREAARLARHDALVRVPGAGMPAVLALASRERLPIAPGQGTGALAFLGRVVGTALARRP